MPLGARQVQAISRPLSHDELVQLQRIAAQAGSLLMWVDEDMIWRAPREGKPGRPVVFLRCGHLVLPVDQDPFQAAIPPDLRDGGSPTEVGGAALARAGLHDAVAQAKDPDRADPLSPCGWPAEPAGPSRDIAAQCPAGQWTAPRSRSLAMAPSRGLQSNHCRVTNGRPASMGCKADASGARCIWPWTRPHPTSAPWNSPPGRDGDSPLLPDLRGQIPEDEQINTVTGPLSGHRVAMPCRAVDGAYDTRRCHTAILARGPTPIIPIRKNGRACKED
jgi:hypothetical protein